MRELHVVEQTLNLSPDEEYAGGKIARWFAEPISSTLKMEAICSSET
jgi:hypothetical protein